MTKRLFLGISPDSSQVEQLTKLQQAMPFGRPVKTANLHMTLFFVGTIDEMTAQRLVSASDNLRWPKFEVTLDDLRFWRRPKVICLAGKVKDIKLSHIINNIYQIVADLGLEIPKFGFTPHITLLRKAKSLPNRLSQASAANSITLRPSCINLYQSISVDNGVEYHIIKSWQLE